ncbi:TRAP transporter large permease [Corticicoccus populi]|uniref:TRAP transporter large permease n=1 Tax=Corticicoccus populi TaxID=1812821 RepID=A0ABW5WYI0_9STAP
MILFFFVVLFVLLILTVPIAFSLGLASTLGVFMHETLNLQVIGQVIFNSLNSFPLMAIPFFILAGNLMAVGGIAKRLVDFAMTLIGHFTGGLAMAAILTSMIFASMSGSGAATTAAIGTILIPAMVAKGYKIEYASANQAIAGSLGIIIPPSIALILFGVSAEVSISDLFLATIIPGLLITVSLMIAAFFISKKNGWKGVEQRSSLKDVGKAFKSAILALLTPVIVLGGIYGGIFTPTEASVIAVVYSFLVGFIIYREIKITDLFEIFRKSAVSTAVIMIVIGTAGLFGFYLSITGVPEMVYDMIDSTIANKIMFLLVLNILLLLMGMFMDGSAAILILVPLLLPTAIEFGIDPVHFGVIMICNLAIGLVTPPVGIDLFVVSQITKVPIMRVAKAVLPLVVIMFIDVLLITYLPFLSTWLPSVMK